MNRRKLFTITIISIGTICIIIDSIIIAHFVVRFW